jgi:alpha-tubulin suppressor-like RCC1 family protein
VAIAAGAGHICALLTSGRVACWGWNDDGQTGNGKEGTELYYNIAPPTVVPGISGATAIAAGGTHSCAVLAGGKVACWGANTNGQAGKGTVSGTELSPVPVAGFGGAGVLSGATAIEAGYAHSCAVLAGGAVTCWGDNGSSQLGDGSGTDSPFPVAVKGPGGSGALSGVVAVDAGGSHSCATTAGGGAYCWGDGRQRQLGAAAPDGIESFPDAVVGLAGPVWSISAGGVHTCAILADGRLSCWGYRGHWRGLGDGIAGRRRVPEPVLDGAGEAVSAASVVSGEGFSCAVTTADGAVSCWGRGEFGELATGAAAPDTAVPVTVKQNGAPLAGVVELAAGARHVCARRDDGTVACWGSDSSGQVGSGSIGGISPPITVVNLGGSATRIVAGSSHSCAIVAGAAKCWGNNASGQLGDNSKFDSPAPVDVAGLNGFTVTDLAAGEGHTCAIVQSGAIVGAVRCWGENDDGQIGNAGVASVGSLTPVQTDLLDGIDGNAASISAGANHTCAVVKYGTVMCWGKNSLLGTGNIYPATSPVAVKGVDGTGSLSGVAAVEAGDFHSCARLTSGALRCWGYNSAGQLGTGDYKDSSLPAAAGAGGAELDIAQVSTGGSHTCAVATAGGTLSCWGSRFYGQLGDGVLGYAATPVLVGPKVDAAVTFRDRGTVIGTVMLVNGVATLKKKLAAGLHSLTASYAGGPGFASWTSKAVAHLVTGTPGADRISGTSGKDTLKGMAGADRIAGGSGDDTIDGGSGNDVIEGGSGKDRLTGGTGRDRFVFRRASDSPRSRPDTVTDFRAGDRIDLSAFDIRPKAKQINRFTVFLGKRKFTGRAGEVRFDAKRRALEGDVNGDRRADFRVLLTGVKSLRASAVKLR